jgi:hypothetical protein
LRIAEGPIAGSIVYQVVRSAGGSVARIRGQVEVDGLGLPASLISGPVRAALTGDLKRLKALVEDARAATPGRA